MSAPNKIVSREMARTAWEMKRSGFARWKELGLLFGISHNTLRFAAWRHADVGEV